MYPSQVIGQDVVLKILSPTEDNAEKVCSLVQKNKDYLSVFFQKLVHAFSDKRGTLNVLRFDEEQRECQKAINYYIFVKDKIIGEISASWLSKDSYASIVYWLDEKYSGKGYMSQSVKMMENLLFKAGHNEIRLYIDAANWRSAKVADNNEYQISECTNYYFKTKQKWWNNCKSVCRQDIFLHRKGVLKELFR